MKKTVNFHDKISFLELFQGLLGKDGVMDAPKDSLGKSGTACTREVVEHASDTQEILLQEQQRG